MKSERILEEMGNINETYLEDAPRKARLAGSSRRARVIAAAACAAVLLVAGGAFAAGKLGWIDFALKPMQFTEGPGGDTVEKEGYIETYNLTELADPTDFSDELYGAIEAPEAYFPAEYLSMLSAYDDGEVKGLDGVYFKTRADAIAFVGYPGIKSFEELGFAEQPGNDEYAVSTLLSARMHDGKITEVFFTTDYCGTQGIASIGISTEIYSTAIENGTVAWSGALNGKQFETVTAASGAKGIKMTTAKSTDYYPDGAACSVVTCKVPVGAVVYMLDLWVLEGAEAEAETIIANWLSLL